MLVGAVLVGLFRQSLSSTVTLVNARSIAEQRGIEVIESQSNRGRDFTSLISLKLYTSAGERWAEGAVFTPAEPRLVLLNGVAIEAALEGTLVVIENNDQPGVIGEVGTILGRHQVNIATFALGRSGAGALGVVNIESGSRDGGSDAAMLDELQQVSAIHRARLIQL
jgi:D-3-phosphoglycerate dehydrogenase